MFTDMFVHLKVHHSKIMHHTPFNYVGGYVHEVTGYGVDFFSMWEVKELVRDFEYVNDVRCWYNVGAEHEQVISLNTDADIVDFLNIVEMYKFEVVHLYVKHMVDYVIMVNEPLFLEACQTQVGKRSGGVDEVHMAGCEDGDEVSSNE
jgi:hypothetical protein